MLYVTLKHTNQQNDCIYDKFWYMAYTVSKIFTVKVLLNDNELQKKIIKKQAETTSENVIYYYHVFQFTIL